MKSLAEPDNFMGKNRRKSVWVAAVPACPTFAGRILVAN
jgi:hypothetical protein